MINMTGDIGVIVTSVAGLVGVLGNLWVQIKNAKTLAVNAETLRVQSVKIDNQSIKLDKTSDKVDVAVAKVEAVHLATNSLTDKLVASTEKAAHQEGVIAGVALEQDRAAVAAAALPPPVAP